MTTAFYVIGLLSIIGFVIYSATRKRKSNDKPIMKIYPHYNIKPIDFEVLRVINEYRISLGLSICKLDFHTCDVANSHSIYMANKQRASHDYDFERRNQFPNKIVGEIVAYNYQSASSVVIGWKNSTGHNKHMINPNYKNIGIATATDVNSKLYYTVIFTS